MKDYEAFLPLIISGASGSYLELSNGKKLIDAISSWWCKSLGHQHPRLKKALLNQIEKFEHVILANTTNEVIVRLSEQLAGLTSTLDKVFYAGDGSCAVEIAMKMSVHARKNQGEPHRHLFIALENGFHGETVGALSVSDVGLYRDPYRSMLFPCYFLSPLPYVNNVADPLWVNCEKEWQRIEPMLLQHAKKTTAIIVEPIVQGAGGMKIYSQDFLRRLHLFAKQHNIHLSADEIMTGLGRTGKMLACEHAKIEPDFICLSKGLTSGWLSFSAVLTSKAIYDLFYDDAKQKAFLHSHTFSGNALAASIASEVLNIMVEENLCDRANVINKIMYQNMLEVAAQTGRLTNVRGLGAMVAADLIDNENDSRLGYRIYQNATAMGALLRPLGNTLYWLPPLNIDDDSLESLKQITKDAIMSV